MYESAAPISGRLFLFSDSRDAKRLWSAEIHLRFQIMRKFYTRPCIASRTGRAARRVTTFECKHRRNCPEGSEHRAFGLRMAPGDVAHVPRTPSPVAEAGPVARHFRSRARLRRLLVRLRRPTPSTPALRATPGGASLTTFGFVTIVPRYLPEASNSLTFVRGAYRAYLCRKNGYGD